MEGIDYFVQLYNKYSDDDINVEDIKVIYPKIQMILNKIELDEIDTFDLIDTLIFLIIKNY